MQNFKSEILNSKWSDFADSGIFNSTSIPLLQDENVTCCGFKDVDFHYFAKVATNPIELVNFEGSSPLHCIDFQASQLKLGNGQR